MLIFLEEIVKHCHNTLGENLAASSPSDLGDNRLRELSYLQAAIRAANITGDSDSLWSSPGAVWGSGSRNHRSSLARDLADQLLSPEVKVYRFIT